MKSKSFIILATSFFISNALYAQDPAAPDAPEVAAAEKAPEYDIQPCTSGVAHPKDGTETLDFTHDGVNLHLRISHPKLTADTHASTVFFWATDEKTKATADKITSLKPRINATNWHSINGYFFSQKGTNFKGFFLIDGTEKEDKTTSGLIFTYDEGHLTSYEWNYTLSPKGDKGGYTVSDPNRLYAIDPFFVKHISPILKHAEKESNTWAKE